MEERNTNYYTKDGLIMRYEQIDIGAPVKIALDHGWSSIKGEHIFIETLVSPVDYTPLTNSGLLEYRGKKYIIGQGRLGKQATKIENDNYFLLTLAGIAKELRYQGLEKTTHVNQGFLPDSLRGEIRETCRELVDLKFRILPALENVACGKKYQKKPGNTASGKESG